MIISQYYSVIEFFSDYCSMSPVSPLTDVSLSPIEKILYSNLLSRQSASPVRTPPVPNEVERSVAGTPFETTDNSGLDSMMVSHFCARENAARAFPRLIFA